MPADQTRVRLVRVFVSSPGDVSEERRVLDEVIERINRTDGNRMGVRLEVWKWEANAVPQIGRRPQDVVDRQTPHYDIYLGIMAHRFGTPTEAHGSGTEQEFRDAARRWGETGKPWILFYFSEAKVDPFEIDLDQIAKVRKFREELGNRGLTSSYDGVRQTKDSFVFKVEEHLRKLIPLVCPPGDENGDAPPPPEPPKSRDPTRYLRDLHVHNAFIDIRGLQVGSGAAMRFPIDELFIPLTTTFQAELAGRSPDDALHTIADRTAAGGPRLEQGSRRIELHEALRQRLLVIVGDPGSGKTTFARRIAFLLCETLLGHDRQAAARELGFDEPPFPVLIRVSELLQHIAAADDRRQGPLGAAAPRWIPHFLGTVSSEAGFELDEEFFKNQLDQGNCLVILDGLDEAPTEKQRSTLSRLAEKAAAAFPKCRMVVTTRPAAYKHEVVLSGFDQVQIHPLEDDAIERFLRRWCAALFPDSRAQEDQHLGELLFALRSRIDIRRLARNPVMLTALAVVHWNEKRIPEQRADLYESIIAWLSRARPRDKDRLTPERCVDLLQKLALAMQDHPDGRQVQVPRYWAARVLAPHWRELPEDRRCEAAERFLIQEELDSGIVVGRGDQVRFWHLTFQEYLAARGLAALGEQEQRDLLISQDKLYSDEWKEVVLLLAGVLFHQGSERVERLVVNVIDQLGTVPPLTDQAMCAGLLGAAVHDLSPVNYQPRDSRYAKILEAVLGVFEPDFHRSAHAGGWWRRVIGVVSKKWSYSALMDVAVKAADALGQAGDPRFHGSNAHKNWITIPGGTYEVAETGQEFNLETYQIGRYPVTVGEFQKFLENDGYKQPRWWKAGGFGEVTEPVDWEEQLGYPTRPVVGVSWFEASAFAAWSGGRLPTEAEWERAARGEGREYPWGDEPIDPSRANYRSSCINHPTPVGIYPLGATPEGICDMAGNVWEWCKDEHKDDVGRVLRGGSFGNAADDCRSAFRWNWRPDLRFHNLGFRVSRTYH